MHDMGEVPFSAHLAVQFKNPLFAMAYLLGSLSVIFHFANGLCTFCMSWGITVGPTSQRIMAQAAAGVGAVLAAMTIASIAGFARMDPELAMKVGKKVHSKPEVVSAARR